MKFIKQSSLVNPKITLVLLDWSVRESFHLLFYLSKQTLPRDQFEVVIIEYYSVVSEAVRTFIEQVDTWLLLEMPKTCYYHKHLMYNVGIAAAQGEIIIICDSDAMVKPSFLQSVLLAFEDDPDIVLHVDQFRNNRRDFYPFCFPSFEEVLDRGCINNVEGKTKGVMPTDDPIHERNYGACLCAKRADLIGIGGADEHIDFIGHICGPYDLTFRLSNLGKKEVWHQDEFLYHTWHPGQAGAGNYLGPHDGRHMSTTSLEAICYRRIFPHVMNPVISNSLVNCQKIAGFEVDSCLISQDNFVITRPVFLKSTQNRVWAEKTRSYFTYWGHHISKDAERYQASPILNTLSQKPYTLVSSDIALIKRQIMIKTVHKIFCFASIFFIFSPYVATVLLIKFLRQMISFFKQNRKKIAVDRARAFQVGSEISRKFSILSQRPVIIRIASLTVSAMIYFVQFSCKIYRFAIKILKKFKNRFFEKRTHMDDLLRLLLNVSFIDRKEDQKIFLLINNSFSSFLILSLLMMFLRKEFINIKTVWDNNRVHECLEQVSHEDPEESLVVIVSKACFLKHRSRLSGTGLNENKCRTIVV